MPYRFRDARIQSGKSLAEAAEELLVSKTTLSNWESGRRVPSVEALEKLADLYGVSVDYLLGRTDQMNPFKEVSESVDPHIIQIGSRNMSNYALLKEVGKSRHPVLLKRGYMSTISEYLLSAEYIAAAGNTNLILCERGIRSFDNSTRNLLDISGIALIQKETSLPMIVDLSHSLGRKDILLPVAKAVLAMGIDGIMLEVHPDPGNALSDQQQQLNLHELESFLKAIRWDKDS